MPFSFTFSFSVPGIINPFSSPEPVPFHPPIERHQPTQQALFSRASSSLSLSLSSSIPTSSKRRWEPSLAEPSCAITSATSTSGYLDTPAKYRSMADQMYRGSEEMISDIPPAKRRRTLTGSIFSTALSAALIGTAVGLTVYRLWRGRGKEQEQLPPPPYEQGEWVSVSSQSLALPPKDVQVDPPPSPSSRHRKIHHTPSGRRHHTRYRKCRSTVSQGSSLPRTASPLVSSIAHARPRSDCVHPDEQDQRQEEDIVQMDWIGDKLSQLIAEGQKALGREVVVMSEVEEDEVDDGDGQWEEDDRTVAFGSPSSFSSRHASLRRVCKSNNVAFPLPDAHYSPRKSRSEYASTGYASDHAVSRELSLSSPRLIQRGFGLESDDFSIGSSFREDESWHSPEMRETMGKARERFSLTRG